MHYCYRHIRLDKNEPFYIGMGTVNINATTHRSRYKRAFTKSHRTDHWKNIAKNGYNVEIIFESENRVDIEEKEKEFIAIYGLKCDGGLLCNFTYGGERSAIPSSELREIISSKLKGRPNKYNKGRHLSEEQKQLLREANKGQIPWNKGKGKPKPEKPPKIKVEKLNNKPHKNRGKNLSEEQKNRVSESLKGRIAWNKGLNLSPDITNSSSLNIVKGRNRGKMVYCEENFTIYNSIAECVRELFNMRTALSTDNVYKSLRYGVSIACNNGGGMFNGYTFKFI